MVMRNEGQVGQIIEEAPGAVFVVMRDVKVGSAYRVVRKEVLVFFRERSLLFLEVE